jgi:hypothetical protein
LLEDLQSLEHAGDGVEPPDHLGCGELEGEHTPPRDLESLGGDEVASLRV